MTGDDPELTPTAALVEITRVRAENDELRRLLADCREELRHAYRIIAKLRSDQENPTRRP